MKYNTFYNNSCRPVLRYNYYYFQITIFGGNYYVTYLLFLSNSVQVEIHYLEQFKSFFINLIYLSVSCMECQSQLQLHVWMHQVCYILCSFVHIEEEGIVCMYFWVSMKHKAASQKAHAIQHKIIRVIILQGPSSNFFA